MYLLVGGGIRFEQGVQVLDTGGLFEEVVEVPTGFSECLFGERREFVAVMSRYIICSATASRKSPDALVPVAQLRNKASAGLIETVVLTVFCDIR